MQLICGTLMLRKLSCAHGRRWLTQSCTGFETQTLSPIVKHQIETYWRDNIVEGKFNAADTENKFYVLSMFPYPSGNLHMGHVRVYTISDAVARFYRLNGKNVFQPIGWDSFGLPAENAAMQRKIEPSEWTKQNVAQMKEQLQMLGCSFDWQHELSTCNDNYYKWTQKLFLMLFKEGLAYQNEALVNWDPVDETVLADEQVDANGYSWRSGAKVQKKRLRQWFIRTSAFAKRLLDGLDDTMLRDWRDIINLQRHWIGPCNGYVFHLFTTDIDYLRVWTEHPEHFKDPRSFIVLRSTHFLTKDPEAMDLRVENPFTGKTMPAIFCDDVQFPDKAEVYLAAPSFRLEDQKIEKKYVKQEQINPFGDLSQEKVDAKKAREEVLEAAQRLRIGGYQVSSHLQDWLISRQRYWGTPIPIIHCPKCGAVPVPDKQLPLRLPTSKEKHSKANNCTCPACGNMDAKHETDTMDTFFDSSWYFLRFLDPKNKDAIFDKHIVKKCMPVDLYIGGKEHAVLHLYYARFMNQFLHSQGLVPTSEPFSRLLVQGMVMGRSYRVKKSGQYVQDHEVEVTNEKKNQAVLKNTKEPVTMSWEKMSKSKLNGVNPNEMFSEHGTDTTRLIILADVAPTSHRNWTSATFPGIINWQKRLWLTINDFYDTRSNTDEAVMLESQSEQFEEEEDKLFDARNFYIKGATFNYRHTHQLSVAISKMQGLTNTLRRTAKANVRLGRQFERALASQIIMLAPMAPHFGSELWAKFVSTPNRLNEGEWQWDRDVLEQRWPEIDMDYKLDLTIKINGYENNVIKIARSFIDKVTHNDAMDIAFNTESVTTYLIDKKIRNTNFVLYPGIEAVLNIYVDKAKKGETGKSKRPGDTELINK